jgi:hypothetical protein
MEFNISIHASSVEEEFEYVCSLFDDMEFYKEYGYEVLVPIHSEFQKFIENYESWKSADRMELKSIFSQLIYEENFYFAGVEKLNNRKGDIQEVISRLKEFSWFKISPFYEIVLTRYGSGGTYDAKTGRIVMLIFKDGSAKRKDPLGTIAHEIVHIGIEEEIVGKYSLTHQEKEAIVDKICITLFSDIISSYKTQDLGDKDIAKLITKENIIKLPTIIEKYKLAEK